MSEITPTTDLAALFALDPNKYTQQDIDAVIAAFRGMRHLFIQGVKNAGSTKPKTAKSKEVDKLDLGNIEL